MYEQITCFCKTFETDGFSSFSWSFLKWLHSSHSQASCSKVSVQQRRRPCLPTHSYLAPENWLERDKRQLVPDQYSQKSWSWYLQMSSWVSANVYGHDNLPIQFPKMPSKTVAHFCNDALYNCVVIWHFFAAGVSCRTLCCCGSHNMSHAWLTMTVPLFTC